MKKLLLVSSIILVIAAPDVAQSSSDPTEQVRNEWEKSWNAKQLDTLMSLYANDSALLPPSGARIVGKENIRAHFKNIFDSASTLTITLTSQTSGSSGQLAYDSGSYDETIRPHGTTISGKTSISGSVSISGGGGVPQKARGSYLIVLRREANKLLIVQQAVTENTDSHSH
jgi:ketosteroid isomerase-like protein